nr:virion core protein [Oriental turtle dovepox virus]
MWYNKRHVEQQLVKLFFSLLHHITYYGYCQFIVVQLITYYGYCQYRSLTYSFHFTHYGYCQFIVV